MLKVMLTTLAATSALAFTAIAPPLPKLIWNASSSVPVGLYAIGEAERLQITDLVLVQPAEPLARFLADGGYLGHGVPLLKRVAALSGHTVCREGVTVTVQGIVTVEARERDSAGRALPHWSGCRTLGDGEVFLLNWDKPASLDGRYFGPVPITSVVGRASPVWTRSDD